MKTLVIHPEDKTTDFLSMIYEGRDWTIIRHNASKSQIRDQIRNHDRIVMLGHGTSQGLLGFGRYMIDSNLVHLLREKDCVCIWCNADMFVKRYKLKGFYTGMIISEYEEALMFDIPTDYNALEESNRDFANAVRLTINDEDMLNLTKLLYEGNNAVVEFNRNNLYYEKTNN